MQFSNLRSTLLWSLIFAGLITLSHAMTLTLFAASLPILELWIPFCFLVPIGTLVLNVRHLHITLFAFLLTLVTSFQIFAFHYQALFSSLPGVNTLYYFLEVDQLTSSLSGFTLYASVAGQIVVSTGLLLWLNRKSKSTDLRSSLLIILALLPIGLWLQLKPLATDADARLVATDPMVWMFRSIIEPGQGLQSSSEHTLIPDFLALHGIPAKPGQPSHCETTTSTIDHKPPETIVLITMESVSAKDVNRDIDGKPLMPNLRTLTAQNLSFDNFVAAGSKSVQSLVATYSGIPVHPMQVLLHQSPMLKYDGFPRSLNNAGYRTAYFHGADLQFENQDRYLKAVGFESLHSRHPDKPFEIRGWGYDDRDTLTELQTWLANTDGKKFAALSTLTTHDPYVLPDDWQPVFSSQTRTKPASLFDPSTPDAQIEAYHFADYQLGEFVRWFRQQFPEGILIITADHPLQSTLTGSPITMQVPLILVGINPLTQLPFSGNDPRSASHYDIAQTIADITGATIPCSLGQSLLKPDVSRIVYTIAGHDMEKFQIYQDDTILLLNRLSGQLDVHTANEQRTHPLTALPPAYDQIFGTLITSHHQLLTSDSYFPVATSTKSTREIEPVEDFSEVLFVSHRGNTRGVDESIENSDEALQNVVESPFTWVEIDLQITGDNILILHHDPIVRTSKGDVVISETKLEDLQKNPEIGPVKTLESTLNQYKDTLNFLLELKPPSASVYRQLEMANALIKVIRDTNTKDQVIVDSFSRYMASFVKARCDCQVGFDAPFQESLSNAELKDIADSNFDWIYVHYRVFNQQLLAEAHNAGLKVMVYTVNDPLQVNDWRSSGYLPNGILTDDQEIID